MVIKEKGIDQQMYPSKEVQQLWYDSWILVLAICFGTDCSFLYQTYWIMWLHCNELLEKLEQQV